MDNLDLELERVIIPEGGKDHSKLQNLDYENSGHTGFASLEQLNATNEKVSTLEEQVQTNASAIQALSEGIDPEKIDGIKDLINYVEEHEVDVVSIQEGIEQNANDIDTLEGKTAELEEKVTALEEKPSTPSGEPLVATFNITAANTTVTAQNMQDTSYIDWGDGTVEEIDYNTKKVFTHTYAYSGTYDAMFYGLTNMNGQCFENQTRIVSVIIPPRVASIGEYSFSGCTRLSVVQLPQNISSIGQRAFYGCARLNDINLNNIKTLGDSALAQCQSLTNIIIDKKCALSSSVFNACSVLESITFNGGADFNYALPFNGCPKLKYVYLFGNKATLGAATGSFPATAKVIVPYSELEAYKSDEKWATIASQIDAYAMASDIGNINTQLANIIEGEGV